VPSARQKALGKEGFADALFAEPSLPSVLRLHRVLQTLGKAIDFGSESTVMKFIYL
jgi:hypothetical protein